ncbi:MAG: YjfB family protein [Sulfurisoma sp.]|nr:YjfB family protein [Sulfurisoma sp.]
MDVTTLAAIGTAMSQEKTAGAAQTAVLKKALDVQAQGALQLVQAATQSMPAVSNPPHLGNNVNIFA